MTVDTAGAMHTIGVQIYSDDLVQNQFRLELYAEGLNGQPPVRQEMLRDRSLVDAPGFWLFSARVPADRPATDYTPRVIPQHPGVTIPLEDARILWHR
jgi:starch phosphorylase